MLDLQKLYESVQKNCHISDGLHAQDYGLCTYLLKMRELYRWEKGLPLTAQLPKEVYRLMRSEERANALVKHGANFVSLLCRKSGRQCHFDS